MQEINQLLSSGDKDKIVGSITKDDLFTQQQFLSQPTERIETILNKALQIKKILRDEKKTTCGLLIQAPCGTGKSTWISNRSADEQKIWLDGDIILEKKGIKNRNYFWYGRQYVKEREAIIGTFEKYLAKGCNILYSGNPMLMKTDVMILPSSEDRWKRLQERKRSGDWCPEKQQFDREEKIYRQARKTIPYIITPSHCPIPSPEYIVKFFNEITTKDEFCTRK